MKHGQFAKGGLWMACWMHGWAEAAHTHTLAIPSPSLSPSNPPPLPCSRCLYPICPSPRTAPNGTEAGRERMRCVPGAFLRQAEREAIRHLGTAGVWLETHSEQVSSRHGCCLTLGELGCGGAAPSIYLALMVFAPQIKWCLSDSWRALGGCLLTQQTEKTPQTECTSTTFQHKMPLSAHNHTSKWQFIEIYGKMMLLNIWRGQNSVYLFGRRGIIWLYRSVILNPPNHPEFAAKTSSLLFKLLLMRWETLLFKVVVHGNQWKDDGVQCFNKSKQCKKTTLFLSFSNFKIKTLKISLRVLHIYSSFHENYRF